MSKLFVIELNTFNIFSSAPDSKYWSRLLISRSKCRVCSALCTRMNWWYSTRCDLYRSVRNDVKLTKCHEMLWCEAAWGQLWPILCYEAGHKWTQPTLQCTSCAVCIGRHNCRHYNWLAAVSVLGCLQKQKKHFFHHLHFKIKLVYYDGFSV